MPGIAQSITMTCGLSCRGQPDGFLAVARLADDDHRRVVLEQAAEAAPYQAVIVGEQDRDRSVPRASLSVNYLCPFGIPITHW